MSVQTEIDRIITAVQAAHEKVVAKGGTTAQPYLVANLAGAIDTIPNAEDLNAVLTEQESLIAELQDALKGKASGGGQYETWTITYKDGTIEELKVVLV